MRTRLRRIRDRLWGPTGSVVLHLLLLLLLIHLVRIDTRKPPVADNPVTWLDDEKILITDPPPEPPRKPDLHDDDFTFTPPVPEPDPKYERLDQPDPVVEFKAVVFTPPTELNIYVNNVFSNRLKTERMRMDKRMAGPWAPDANRAVNRALEWLREQQQADGSWKQNPVAMTGLALLTFLAHAETVSSEDYGDTVQKAIRYLMDQQQPDGGLGPARSSGPATYAHAVATYALAEAFGMTRNPAIKKTLEPAVQVLLDGQQAGGGWDYGYAQGPRRDTSVSGWHIQALKAAYLAGAENPGLKEAMARAVQDLQQMVNPADGSFGYTRPGDGNWRMTGVGTLCLQLLGGADSREVRQGLRNLNDLDCDWNRDGHLYGWYYVTQAKFHAGGPAWSTWNNRFAQTLLQAQQDDGHWDFPTLGPGRHEHGADQGPVYSTTLAALTLQVYHRTLPTYTGEAVKKESFLEKAAEDDVNVESI